MHTFLTHLLLCINTYLISKGFSYIHVISHLQQSHLINLAEYLNISRIKLQIFLIGIHCNPGFLFLCGTLSGFKIWCCIILCHKSEIIFFSFSFSEVSYCYRIYLYSQLRKQECSIEQILTFYWMFYVSF